LVPYVDIPRKESEQIWELVHSVQVMHPSDLKDQNMVEKHREPFIELELGNGNWTLTFLLSPKASAGPCPHPKFRKLDVQVQCFQTLTIVVASLTQSLSVMNSLASTALPLLRTCQYTGRIIAEVAKRGFARSSRSLRQRMRFPSIRSAQLLALTLERRYSSSF